MVVVQMLLMGIISCYQVMSHKRSVLLTQIWAYRCQNGRMQLLYFAEVTYHLVSNSDVYYLGLATGTLTVESLSNLTLYFFAFSYSFVNMLKARSGEQQLARHFRLTWELIQLIMVSCIAFALYSFRATSLSFIIDMNGELLRKTSDGGAALCKLRDSCVVFKHNMALALTVVSLGLGFVAAGVTMIEFPVQAAYDIRTALSRPTISTIRRSRSTLQFSFAPFFFYFVQSAIYTLYGYTTSNVVVGGTSLLGAVLGSYYVLVFYKYTKDRTQATRMLTSAMLVILLLAHQVMTRELEETQMITGIPANILSVFTAASPLLQVKSILRRKDASCLPFGMSTMNVVSGTIWATYGVMLGDQLVICPNFFALSMGVIQVSLILLYPGGKTGAGSVAETKAKMSSPTTTTTKKASPKHKSEHLKD
ncbi:hypothetical protein BBO99_00004696 [Phytophthora kernoviae]|uniref:Sugar transporter SWEET1 n=1 Tax=Phytophthora kernoviae TaxID=325452 RepID=A0A3R7IMW5_9STRA|nr:hypothetical protein BBI17_002933 [Phytophthora kernoviae]RLN80187.1 hypothetical protein BBO99_00004696 [Phytophthora kernoviae]